MTTLATQRHDTHGVSTRERRHWTEDAACKGVPTEALYPEEIRGATRQNDVVTWIRSNFCQHCPVAQACLAEAERLPDKFGVRGGYSARERGWWNPR